MAGGCIPPEGFRADYLEGSPVHMHLARAQKPHDVHSKLALRTLANADHTETDPSPPTDDRCDQSGHFQVDSPHFYLDGRQLIGGYLQEGGFD